MPSSTDSYPDMPLRLAVFDCDGTLVDSQESIIAAMHMACETHNLPKPDAGSIRRMVGLSLVETFARLFPHTDAEDCERLRLSYSEAFFTMRQNGLVSEPLYPGATAALDAIKANGWLIGMATGKSMRGLVATLDRHRLGDRFATLQTADKAQGKPNPDMLHQAMGETGAQAAMTVMVGDTTFDMEMARNAGTLAVGVAWGYHPAGELRKAGAHEVIEDFGELIPVLENLVVN